MKRQWLSAVLIGAMMATSVPAFAAENTGETTPEAPTLPFTDVAESDWFYDPVVYAYDTGIMTGTSATEFAPNVTMTRAMIASVLYRLEGSPAMSEGNLGYPYEDVEGDAWYAMPVYWARESGVMAGYSDSTFGPNDPITREQLAATLYKYAEYRGEDVSARTDLSGYSDAATISDWAEEVLSWANAEGYVNGMTSTTIDPQSGATRAQVAAIFQRYLEGDTAPVDPEGETVQLKIGRSGHLQTVEATVDDVTPDNVIAALAAETGWNLDLAKPVSVDENGIATVVFAADSGVYGEPPEPQKDAYHVYDVEDWIYTVFNSVAESLQANGATYVCFTAPDGGKLVIDQGDVHFYLMPTFQWNEEIAYDSNHIPEDRVGAMSPVPYGEGTALGMDSLVIYYDADDLTLGSGTVTVYDANGDVVATVDLSDEEWVILDHGVHANELLPQLSAQGNYQTVTALIVRLPEPLMEGDYSVNMPEGAVVNSDGIKSRAIPPEEWTFSVAGYGMPHGVTYDPNMTVGETFSLDVAIDGEYVDRAEVVCDERYVSSDVTTLTESGTVTFTVTGTTDGQVVYPFEIDFYKGDTYVYGISGYFVSGEADE